MHTRFLPFWLITATLAGCSESKPLTSDELIALVRSIVHEKSECIERTGGMLVSCGSGNQGGTVKAYVIGNDASAVHIDYRMSVSASTGAMVALSNYARDVVGKLGLEGEDYQNCTDIDTTQRKTSSYRLAQYNVECVAYVGMMMFNVEMAFVPR